MNKQELVSKVAEATGYAKKEVEPVVAEVFSQVKNALANGDDVNIPNFGKFFVKDRSARNGRNPQTGETIEIAAKKVPSLKFAKAVKDAIEL